MNAPFGGAPVGGATLMADAGDEDGEEEEEHTTEDDNDDGADVMLDFSLLCKDPRLFSPARKEENGE